MWGVSVAEWVCAWTGVCVRAWTGVCVCVRGRVCVCACLDGCVCVRAWTGVCASRVGASVYVRARVHTL